MFSLPHITKNGASKGRPCKILSSALLALALTACRGPVSRPAGDTQQPDSPSTMQTTDTTGRTQVPDKSKEQVASADMLIIPGRFIGKVKLGDADTAVLRLLGKPDSSDAAMGKAWLFWMSNNGRTGVFTSRNMGTVDETARVVEVYVSSPNFATIDKVRTGDSLARIQRSFPRLVAQDGGRVYDDRNAGIGFVVDANGRCTGIIVHRPGTDPQAITGVLLNP